MTGLEVAEMTKAQMENEELYHGTMMVARNLLNQGIISEKEYTQIDTKFRQKYKVSLSTLFTDIRLIKFGEHGNIGQ
jgi:hypothetical protein